MKPSHLVNQANDLMQAGDQLHAGQLLEQLLNSSPNDSNYADAVAIYLLGNMYSEAIAVFKVYHERTGKDLGRVSDFSLTDIQQQMDRFQRAQQEASVSPISQSTGISLELWPIDPVYIFFMLSFLVLGAYLIFGTFSPEIKREGLGLPMMAFGLFMIFSGVTGMISYMQANDENLVIMATPLKIKRGSVRRGAWLPKRQVLAYSQIDKATVETQSAGIGLGTGLTLSLKDGSTQIINLGPFLKRDCRSLVKLLQSRGVFVFVLPGLLGKNFPG